MYSLVPLSSACPSRTTFIFEFFLTFSFEEISDDISKKLDLLGYKVNVDFIIQFVPNITNITYGRGVGYKIEEESFNSDIESISATKIRKNLRDEGKIK